MTDQIRITGADQFKALARDLRAAGSEGHGLQLSLLKNLRVIAKPIQSDMQRSYFALPAKGPATTGLRTALMRAVRTSVIASGSSPSVKVIVDPKKLPAGQQGLPPLVEGDEKWRHPVYGHTDVWVNQDPHPVVGPVAAKHQNDAQIAALAAVEETIAKLEKGNYLP